MTSRHGRERWAALLPLAVALVLLAACAGDDGPTATTSTTAALGAAFEDDPPEEEVRSQIDTLLRLYDQPVDEESRRHLEAVLTDMGESSGRSEMTLLTCAIQTFDPEREVPDAVTGLNLATAFLPPDGPCEPWEGST